MVLGDVRGDPVGVLEVQGDLEDVLEDLEASFPEEAVSCLEAEVPAFLEVVAFLAFLEAYCDPESPAYWEEGGLSIQGVGVACLGEGEGAHQVPPYPILREVPCPAAAASYVEDLDLLG